MSIGFMGCSTDRIRNDAFAPYGILDSGNLVDIYRTPWSMNADAPVADQLNLLRGLPAFAEVEMGCSSRNGLATRNGSRGVARRKCSQAGRDPRARVGILSWIPSSEVGSYREAVLKARANFVSAVTGAAANIGATEKDANHSTRHDIQKPLHERKLDGFHLEFSWPDGGRSEMNFEPSPESIVVLRGYAPAAAGGYPAYIVIFEIDWTMSGPTFGSRYSDASDMVTMSELANKVPNWMAIVFPKGKLSYKSGDYLRGLGVPSAIANNSLQHQPSVRK